MPLRKITISGPGESSSRSAALFKHEVYTAAKQKVYVAMGLTLAPKEFREDFQKKLKDRLRAISEIELLEFVGLQAGTEIDVYHHDRKCTEDADLLIAICDHPSIGLGMEIVFRHRSGKPMLLFAHQEAKVTRMLLGFAYVESYEFIRYESVKDVVAKVSATLTKLN